MKEDPKGSNAGMAVEAIQAATGNAPPDPYCASFVAYCGKAAFGSTWPVPLTAACKEIGVWAEKKGILLPPPAERGDIFLVWYPSLGRFAHAGVVINPELDNLGRCVTIEANTNPGDGSRDGWGVFERKRKLGPRDRLVRWQSLSTTGHT